MARLLIAPAGGPTLDEVIADPTRATALPRATIQGLLNQCVAAQTVLLGALAASEAGAVNGTPTPADGGERLLTVPEVAERVGMSTSWVEKHAADLPARVSVAGNPRWRKSDLDRWIKNRPQYGKSIVPA